MKKNQSLEADSEIIQMIDSVGWDLHTVVTTICCNIYELYVQDDK